MKVDDGKNRDSGAIGPKSEKRGPLAGCHWLIEPVASPADPRWQDRAIWRRVIVTAPSASFARLTAERWALPPLLPQIGNESAGPQAGFLDEKLYHVRQMPGSCPRAPRRSDHRQVVEAEILRMPSKVIET